MDHNVWRGVQKPESLTCLGVFHADTSVAVKAGRTAAADVADVRRPAVDALNPGETGPAGARGRHVEID